MMMTTRPWNAAIYWLHPVRLGQADRATTPPIQLRRGSSGSFNLLVLRRQKKKQAASFARVFSLCRDALLCHEGGASVCPQCTLAQEFSNAAG